MNGINNQKKVDISVNPVEKKEQKSKIFNRILSGVLIVFNIILLIIVIATFFYPHVLCNVNVQWKPIIYFYPNKEERITVKVNHPEKFTVTYPKYDNGWDVIAKPDGTLTDNKGKNYYALYWESESKKNNPMKEDGFIVEGKDVASFLEEKLEILGLNDREKEEFIIYWLPQLEKNKYNYIRFQTMEEINDNMELNIIPKPETLIRIRMEFKPLKEKIKVKEQILQPVNRNGYTVVEWGGTNVD